MASLMKANTEMSYRLVKSAKEMAQRSEEAQQALTEQDLLRVVNNSQARAKFAFKLLKASVGSEAVLESVPADWQQLEEEHVRDRVFAQSNTLKPSTH